MGRISKRLEDYKKVLEASYLSAVTNASRYRIILRYFFVEHERMRDYIYPEKVLEHVRSIHGMEDYTEEELSQDLNQLVAWKNIVPGQEVKNPRTIAEFNKKVFRYQITSYTVQIERMLEQLQKNGEEFRGSLDKKPFETLYESLQIFLEAKIDKELADTWHNVIRVFTDIRENTADYLAYLSSEKSEELMQKESFLAYKDKFIGYLRDFIFGSNQMAMKIQSLIEYSKENRKERFEYLASIPDFTPRFEEEEIDSESRIEELNELWESLRQWFIDTGAYPSQYSVLLARTNDTIRNITGSIRRIGERMRQKLSRKKDYLHVAHWFLNAEDMQEAHKICASVFGLKNTRHYMTKDIASDDMYEELWKLRPYEFITKPAVRNYKEKSKVLSYVTNTKEKAELIKASREKQRRMDLEISSYMKEGKMVIEKEIHLSVVIRKLLLRWLSMALLSEDGIILTEFGYRIKVELKDEEAVIVSEDGKMTLPSCSFSII